MLLGAADVLTGPPVRLPVRTPARLLRARRYVTGSVEAAVGLGLGHGIVDLVETGTTMRAAGLEVVAEVMTTQTVLVCNRAARDKVLVQRVFQRIKGCVRCRAGLQARPRAVHG